MSLEPRYVCSVDIGGTKIASAILEYPASGGRPQVVYSAEVPTCAQEGGEAVYARIEGAIRAALEEKPELRVLGVGLGSAGVVDPKTGAIAYANAIMPGWSGIELGPRLREALNMPVEVIGDVQAHALGEAHWGAGRGHYSVLCLGIGTGIGGGYVEDGRAMRGFHGAAGHMGHIECTAAPVGVRAISSPWPQALRSGACSMSATVEWMKAVPQWAATSTICVVPVTSAASTSSTMPAFRSVRAWAPWQTFSTPR